MSKKPSARILAFNANRSHAVRPTAIAAGTAPQPNHSATVNRRIAALHGVLAHVSALGAADRRLVLRMAGRATQSGRRRGALIASAR